MPLVFKTGVKLGQFTAECCRLLQVKDPAKAQDPGLFRVDLLMSQKEKEGLLVNAPEQTLHKEDSLEMDLGSA